MTGLFLLACNSTEKAESKVKYSDLANDQIKGDIQTIEETPYKADSTGKIGEMDSCCITVLEYDDNGNTTKYTSKDSKGTVKNESIYTRHENGLWIGSNDTREGGKPSGSMKVAVDDKGQYGVAQTFDSTGKPDIYYTTLAQNEFGQVSGWKQYDKDSVFRQEGAAKFDKNLQVSFTMKDSVGKKKQTYASKYNDKGEQTENSNTMLLKIPQLQKLQNILTNRMMIWATGHSVLHGMIKGRQQLLQREPILTGRNNTFFYK